MKILYLKLVNTRHHGEPSFGDIEYYMQNGYWESDGPPPENNIYSGIIQGILAGGLLISDLFDIGNKNKRYY